ncbi:MAG: sulfatase-like hydrolase/transferase [Solirubrobacterales bacterium]
MPPCWFEEAFLTGQYAHNHRVLDNGPPRGGYARLDAEHALPVWLSRAGYRTAFVGKFPNG